MTDQPGTSQISKRIESTSPSPEEKIARVIANEPLALAVAESVAFALKSQATHLDRGNNVGEVFDHALSAAIRDIETHPRGNLFRRLILHGPPNPDDPESTTSDGETILSDPECGLCVNFIYSHMVNRFKEELAELLALQPCIQLMEQLQEKGSLPQGVQLYWGGSVQERRKLPKPATNSLQSWGSFTKGADGLFVSEDSTDILERGVAVHGIVEVKSMTRSNKQVLDQIRRHENRLLGGVKLGTREIPPSRIRLIPSTSRSKEHCSLFRIIVTPSQWKLSRQLRSEGIDPKTRRIVPDKPTAPLANTRIENLGVDTWKITLGWSQDALHQAAYEMTFWYMAQIGAHIYAEQRLPSWLEHMGPEKAGLNLAKYRLYVIGLRYISRRQGERAIKIYNAYSFGWPFAADFKAEMIWPDDFPHEEQF